MGRFVTKVRGAEGHSTELRVWVFGRVLVVVRADEGWGFR